MLRKIALGLAFVAVLTLPLSAFAARGGHGRGHSMGRSSGHAHMRRTVVRTTVHTRVVHTGRGHGRGHYSHSRHFWHGRWWAYGVGSCWTYDPNYDEYYWTCGD